MIDMKFGVILHKTTMNRGDDIQTYAAMQHLPQVDYVIDRENTNAFRSKEGEPVAVIMSAWWLWKKWNWPPAECIIPKFVSMHMNNYSINRKSSPLYDEWLEGIGGEYFRKYGPIGVRDQTSLDFFTERGFDSYFSGCITLTLPKQKKTEDAGTYVCLVDLNDRLEQAAREMLKDTGLKIKVFTHRCDFRNSDASFEERMEAVEKLLTQYQNAKFVITRRLHASLPCLAMGVPVLSVVKIEDEGNFTRWEPYSKWIHFVSNKDFRTGNFEYDFLNPPENKEDYKATREALMKDIADFVDEMKDCSLPLAQVKKTPYTEQEAKEWRSKLMEFTLNKWLEEDRKFLEEKEELEKSLKRCKKIIRTMENGDDIVKRLEKMDKKSKGFLKRMVKRWWVKEKTDKFMG